MRACFAVAHRAVPSHKSFTIYVVGVTKFVLRPTRRSVEIGTFTISSKVGIEFVFALVAFSESVAYLVFCAFFRKVLVFVDRFGILLGLKQSSGNVVLRH